MTKSPSLAIAALALLSLLPRQEESLSADEIMEADREFSAAVVEGGADAWASWFAPDGAMVQPGIGEIRGRDAIREFVGYLDDPNLSLRWEPNRAELATSGDLGWTTGRYFSETRNADGTVSRGEGVYVSIWRRQPDGAWKVMMDLGNPTGPPPTPAGISETMGSSPR